MDIVGLVHSTIDEACPSTSLAGFFQPTGPQLDLVNAQGRIIAPLRALAQLDNAEQTLTNAALLQLNLLAGLEAVSDLPNLSVALINALCDLVITGEQRLRDFRRRAADLSAFRLALRNRVSESIDSDPLAVGLGTVSNDTINTVCDQMIDRALTVHWALHGPIAHRESVRPTLGWIAVDAEVDTPTRPVNVPAALWPTADSQVSVGHDGRTVNIRVRYAIAGAADAVTEVNVRERLPALERVPVVPVDAMVLVFLHGHSSRLEEAGGIAAALGTEFNKYRGVRPLVVISFDFPTHGYSEYIDHNVISPYDSTTRFVPDHSEERRFGILEYFEKVAVALVEQINADAVSQGQLPLLDRVIAFIGGSMGGNLVLRLSERLVTSVDWLRGLVAWSPASTYGSFGRSEGGVIPIPSPGEHVDIFAKEALDRTHDRALENESDSTRADFIRIQMEGERLINDGTNSFQFWVHALVGLFGPPNIAFQVLAQGLTRAWVGAIVQLRQSDSWLRAACRASYNLREAEQSARLGLSETYNSARRRMHWRVANEQLLFSHQDVIAVSRELPCYAISSVPTLLIAGADDITDSQRFDIYNSSRRIAPQMRANAGTGIFVHDTGHSIHSERPIWLSREVVRFFSGKLNLSQTPRLISAVRRDSRDRITHLCAALSHWSPIAVEDVIEDLRENLFRYFVQASNQENPTEIQLVEMRGDTFLRTETTSTSTDNLDELPLWSVRHLELTIVTANDNLRGGDDNLDVHVYLRDGSVVTRRNVNLSGEWPNNSVNLVNVGLPDRLEPDDLLRIELETAFSGGFAGENWSMAALSVRGIGDGFDKEVGYWGFKRFTGDDHRLSVALNPSPTAPGQIDRLVLSFHTGVDNLRGVDDNISLAIHFADGHVQEAPNINGGRAWDSHSVSNVEIFLDRPVTEEQILRLRFEASFSGGSFGDNWDMDALTVRAIGHSIDNEIVSHGYFRFSGDQRFLTIPVSAVPTPPGHVNMLDFEFVTGGDDLRGDRDNINLWIEFADGRIEEVFNLNDGVKWPNHATTTVTVALSTAVLPQMFRLLRLAATFRGGISGDNWDMKSIVIRASGSDVDVELARYGFKRFTGNDRLLELPIALASPGEANALELMFHTGGDNLRGGNDNLSLMVRFDDGFTQRIPNINGGARWHNNSINTVRVLLKRAVQPTNIIGLDLEASFSGGVGGDNWNMQSLTVRALGNEVDQVLVNHGFKRFRGDDNALSIPIVIGEPGMITALQFKFTTGDDNLRGDTDNVSAMLSYQRDGETQRLFIRNLNGGERWHNHSVHSLIKNLPEAIAPENMLSLELETQFAGGIDGDNWNMELLTVRALGLDLDQDLVATGYKRFRGDDSRHLIMIGPPGMVSALQLEFTTGHDNLRGDNDNVHATINFLGRSSERFLNINHKARWVGGSRHTAIVNLAAPVALANIVSLQLQTTFSGGIGGDNWDMNEVRVLALGNGLRQPLFSHGFHRFTGDNQTLLIARR